MRIPSFARLLIVMAFVVGGLVGGLVGCSDDEGASCPLSGPGAPSGGCERVVDTVAECPRLEDVCANVCGASYDCCYCGDSGQYETLYLDCAPCPDAGADAP